MHDNPESFRHKLLAVEPFPPDVRHRLEQEIHDMMIQKLTVPRRLICAVVAVFATLSAGLCGFLAITEAQLPLAARVGLGVGVLFGLSWAAWSVRVLRSGEISLRRDSRQAAQMVWVFTVLMVVFFLVVGMSVPDRQLGILMILQSLAFLIGAAVYWLSYRIEQAELSVREHLLRSELHIAELLQKR